MEVTKINAYAVSNVYGPEVTKINAYAVSNVYGPEVTKINAYAVSNDLLSIVVGKGNMFLLF